MWLVCTPRREPHGSGVSPTWTLCPGSTRSVPPRRGPHILHPVPPTATWKYAKPTPREQHRLFVQSRPAPGRRAETPRGRQHGELRSGKGPLRAGDPDGAVGPGNGRWASRVVGWGLASPAGPGPEARTKAGGAVILDQVPPVLGPLVPGGCWAPWTVTRQGLVPPKSELQRVLPPALVPKDSGSPPLLVPSGSGYPPGAGSQGWWVPPKAGSRRR